MRIAGSDHAGLRDREVAPRGPHPHDVETGGGNLRVQLHVRHAAAAEPMAAAAVDVEVGAAAAVDRCRAIVRIGKPWQLVFLSGPLDGGERIGLGIGLDDDVFKQALVAECPQLIDRG